MNVQRIAKNLSGRVAAVTGLPTPDGLRVRFGNLGAGGIASTSGDVITIDRSWLQGQNKREVKGVLAHELTHAIQNVPGGSASGKAIEAYADAVRTRLGLGGGAGYDTKLEQKYDSLSGRGLRSVGQAMAQGTYSQDTLQEARHMAGPAAPRPGHDGGRMRNTFANILSKNQVNYTNPGGGQALPALSPAQNANYYAQLGTMYAQYQTTLQALKQQRVGLRVDYRDQLAQIQQQKVAQLASTENAGIERGLAGSSAVSEQMAGVKGAAATAKAGAQRQMLQGVGQNLIQVQQAALGYAQGAQQLQQQKLTQQQELLAQQLQQNLIVSGQESTMDVYRAIYRAIVGANNQPGPNSDQYRREHPPAFHGRGPGGSGGPPPPASGGGYGGGGGGSW